VNPTKKTARIAGLLYLVNGVAGAEMCGENTIISGYGQLAGFSCKRYQ